MDNHTLSIKNFINHILTILVYHTLSFVQPALQKMSKYPLLFAMQKNQKMPILIGYWHLKKTVNINTISLMYSNSNLHFDSIAECSLT